MRLYVLQDRVPVQEFDVWKWNRYMQSSGELIVGSDAVGDTILTTKFIGTDMSMFQDGVPLVFMSSITNLETLESGRLYYHTWEEAESGHLDMLERMNKRALAAAKIVVAELKRIMALPTKEE